MIAYNASGTETGRIWAHQNRIGSVIATTDAGGAILDRYTYSPYGESGPEGDTGFPFRFTGQKLYATLGLYYDKARWYDTEAGRFLQTDPVGYKDQMNLYAYVGNDPVNALDPTGNFKINPADLQRLQQIAQGVSKSPAAAPLVATAAPLLVAGAAINMAIASPTANPEADADFNRKSVNLDTNAVIAVVENPGSEAAQSAIAKVGDRTPLVSEQTASEFLAKGDPAALAGFMAASGALPVPNPSHETTSALMMTGLKEADAKIVGAGLESGAATLTRDQEVLRKVPEITEDF